MSDNQTTADAPCTYCKALPWEPCCYPGGACPGRFPKGIPQYEPTDSTDGGAWGFDWIRRVK